MVEEYSRDPWKLYCFVWLFISFIVVAGVVAVFSKPSSTNDDYEAVYKQLQDALDNYDTLYTSYQEALANYDEAEQNYQEAYQNYLEAEQNYQNALASYQSVQNELNKITDNTDFSGNFYTVVDYEVNYGAATYTRAIHTTYSTYFYYRLDLGHPSHSSPDLQVAADIIETYCIVTSGIISLAQALKAQCIDPNDDEEVVDTLLSFCQHKGDYSRSIKYIEDGFDDFAKYPWETIAEGNGDCEDKAILFGSLVEALGYSAAILVVTGHVFVGVYLASDPTHNYQSPSSWYIEIGGNEYWTCETTVDGWLVGDLPSEYQGEAVYYRLID